MAAAPLNLSGSLQSTAPLLLPNITSKCFCSWNPPDAGWQHCHYYQRFRLECKCTLKAFRKNLCSAGSPGSAQLLLARRPRMLSRQAAARPCHLTHPPPKSLILQGNYGTTHANVARNDQIPSAISSYTSLSQALVAPEEQPGSFLFHVSLLITLMRRRGSVPSTIPAWSKGAPAGALLPQEHCVAKVTRKRFQKLSFLCSSPQLLTRVHYIWLLFSPLRVSYHRLIKTQKSHTKSVDRIGVVVIYHVSPRKEILGDLAKQAENDQESKHASDSSVAYN